MNNVGRQRFYNIPLIFLKLDDRWKRLKIKVDILIIFYIVTFLDTCIVVLIV